MSFRNGKLYTVKKLSKSHHYWTEVQKAVTRRTKPGKGPLRVEELYLVSWREKPFPWSWFEEFKPNRRWFFHGTKKTIIQKILDEGFKAGPTKGRMLGSGVYATYHTNKSKSYGPDGYVLSVMIYTPRVLLRHPKQTLNEFSIWWARVKYDAIEVRTDCVVKGWKMRNHEICVFDARRVIPRFIVKIS